MNEPLLSVVIPVYRNEGSIPALVDALAQLAGRLPGPLECVFVNDGSPDQSGRLLGEALGNQPFRAVVVDHSRNFGSFAAIRTGLAIGTGRFFGVMAADLQEPPTLMDAFVERLSTGDVQLVVGERAARTGDLRRDRAASGLFWRFYRRFVMPSLPEGGVDVFGCSRHVRDQLMSLNEAHSSLIGLLFWLGHPYETVKYERLPRQDGGQSSWTIRRKLRYMSDSVFAFTDLPLRLLRAIGLCGLLFSMIASFAVAIAWWRGTIDVPGYTPLILAMLFATMTIVSALGIVGVYVWRTFENTKARPLGVIAKVESFDR